MKKINYAIIFLLLGLTLNISSYAQEKKDEVKKEVSEQSVEEGKVFNTVCPVSTEEIEDAVTYSYKGVTYAVCCKNCLKKFKKDPEKYISRLSEDGKSLKKKQQ